MTRSVSYGFQGLILRIHGDDRRYLDRLQPRLRAFEPRPDSEADMEVCFRTTRRGNHPLPPPPPDARPVYEEHLGEVLYSDSESRLYLDHGGVKMVLAANAARAEISVEANDPRAAHLAIYPVFTLALIELLKGEGWYCLHAAALASSERALLLPGRRGTGKTTLALALLRAGFDFLTDDHSFLGTTNDQMSVMGLPDEIDVTPTTASFFPELDTLLSNPPRPGFSKQPVLAEDVYDIDIVMEARPVAVVFPRVSNREESQLEPLGKEAALLELVPNVLLTDWGSSQAHLNAIGRLVRAVPCFQLHTGRDFEEVAGVLRGLLRSSNATLEHAKGRGRRSGELTPSLQPDA